MDTNPRGTMMKGPKRAWLLIACLAFACDDQPDEPPPADGAADAVIDADRLDGSGDFEVEPDGAPDAAPDADIDAAPDATADATADAAPDAIADAEPDAIPDAAPDAIPDAAPDVTVDAAVDAEIDAVVDMALPELAVVILQPADGALVSTSPLPVTGRVALPVDGLTVAGEAIEPAPDGTFAADVPLEEGPNAIAAIATRGEDVAEARITVTLDSTPPVVAITDPPDGASVRDAQIEVRGTVDDPTAVVVVNGVAAAVADGGFSLVVALADGENVITATARDPARNAASDSVTITRDADAPAIAITAPEGGAVTADATIEVVGTIDDPAATVSVNGVEAAVADGGFTATVPLAEGDNAIVATATDANGNQSSARVDVIRDGTPPTVAITSPADGAVIAALEVEIRGTVDDRAATVSVNGVPAPVLANGTWAATVPLADGDNPITATAADALGNEATAQITVTRDSGPPAVAITAPADGLRTRADAVEVQGTVDDPDATVTVNGVAAALDGLAFTATVPLAEGDNAIIATATDAVGNAAEARITVTRDLTPPAVAITAPADGAVVGSDVIRVEGTVDDPDATVEVNGIPAPVADGAFAVDVPLAEGNNGVAATATDVAGNVSVAAITVMRDSTPPVVLITVPADGSNLIRRTVRATGSVNDREATVVVAGVEATVEGNAWVADIELEEGANTVEAVATDGVGNVGRATVEVFVDSTPAGIFIDAPEDGLNTGDAQVDVRGRVEGADVERVEVNGVEVEVVDGAFAVDGVSLEEGLNVITAVVTDTFGNVGLARVEVIRDAGAPVIHIETPADGAVLTTTQIDVAGITNDYITGITVSEDDLDIWVNGQPAVVLNRTFTLSDLLLQRGPNTITVEAEDRAGNRSSKSIEVTVVDEAGQRLVLISGQSQGARQGDPVQDPLVVSLLDENGNPVPESPVTFTVVRGDGALDAFPETGRELVVQTDDNGLAAVNFTPGGRAGAGSHRVVATAPGFLGRVEFCTSVYPDDAVQVVAVAGENQMGQTGAALPEAFVALVTDAAGNPVPFTPVTFTALDGGGAFAGEGSVVVETDRDGLARAALTLGPAGGRNAAQATIEALEDPAEQAATFHADAFPPGERAATRVVGQVLDNQDTPIPGVTAWIRLDDGPIISDIADEQGRFAIADAPIGAVHLVIEGETALRDGTWPRLTYDIITVAGVDNDIGGPIYLPELAPENTAEVGGDADVTIAMDGVEGATLTVFANSVTCLDGSSECAITWSQVRGERVPDPAPMGSTFDMVATLQPPGVRFDPPARLCVPNRGNPAGYQQEMFAYDHDLGDWVGIGTGTVTPDGQQICSDSGFGLHKSGWHGTPPPPPPPKCPSNCDNGNPCETGSCKDGQCVYEPKGEGTRCDDGSGCGEATCDANGACVFQSKEENGTECDDNDECTQSSTCQNGACEGADPLECDDEEDCTEDSCDPLQGCLNQPKAEGASCEPSGGRDDSRCVEDYTCQGGACNPKEVECEQDDNPCTEHRCEETGRPPGRGPGTRCTPEPVNEGDACGDSAEGDEQCGQYVCTEGECAPDDGQGDTEGQECDDEDECTEEDRCQNGECKGDPRDLEKVEGGVQIDFSRPVDRIADTMERLINRVPFLQANFGTGGAFGIKASKEDCCNSDTGEFVEFGKVTGTASFGVNAAIVGTLPGLGILQNFEEEIGDNSVSFTIQVGILADLGIGLTGEVKNSENQCVGEGSCTEVGGKIELSGGLRASVVVQACVEIGFFSVEVCPGVNATPARLIATARGSCYLQFGECGGGDPCSFQFGELKFVMEVSYLFGAFTYERVLYAG